MSGHNKWAQIKHKKGVTDVKRGKLFSKLVRAVTIAAKIDPNPKFNPRLRTAIEKAKSNNVPQDNIERAIQRALKGGEGLEELLFEAYDGSGAAILVEVVTDNHNLSVSEIKKLISDHAGKWAESGSVRWAFDQVTEISDTNKNPHLVWRAKFNQELNSEQYAKLQELCSALNEHEDVQAVFTNGTLKNI